jgi:hypothetical protein
MAHLVDAGIEERGEPGLEAYAIGHLDMRVLFGEGAQG